MKYNKHKLSILICAASIAVSALLAAAGVTPIYRPKAQAPPVKALQGEAAIRQLKADGGYASLASAMVTARNQAGEPLLSRQRKLTAEDPAENDQFGAAVAISGDTAVVGAPQDDETGIDQGSVYVYVRDGAGWTLQQKLTAAGGDLFDHFGYAVAVKGDALAVGAPYDDTNRGAVHLFTRSDGTWTERQKLSATDNEPDDFFGGSVAFSEDMLVVGAMYDDVGANADQGSAYVFTRSDAGWMEQQKLTAVDGAADDNFGVSVALNGEAIVVGAYAHDVGASADQGAAYVFTGAGGVWSPQQKLIAADGSAEDQFGRSVAISGDTLAVGAWRDDNGVNKDQGATYVFTSLGGAWSPQQKISPAPGSLAIRFGDSIALSGDLLIVGSSMEHVNEAVDRGAAYVFARTGSEWKHARRLFAGDGEIRDRFGSCVAISGDAALIGAPYHNGAFQDQGAAYLFAIGTHEHVQQQQLVADDGSAGDIFGGAIALSGDTLIVGASQDDIGENVDQGSVYVFVRNGSTWMQQARLIANGGGANDRFGFSVAISGDVVVVGGFGREDYSGIAYIFTRRGSVWTQETLFYANDGVKGDRFGRAVAISGDDLLIGAPGADINGRLNQGAIYIIRRTGSEWTQLGRLTAADGSAGDSFGSSVALSGGVAVIGAFNATVNLSENQGSAYIFSGGGSNWKEQQKLVPEGGAPYDAFGFSVAISGDSVIVGAPANNRSIVLGKGSAFVFVRNGVAWSQQHRLVAADGEAADFFGRAVSIDGDVALVGALGRDIGGRSDRGAAYVFARRGSAWSEQQTLSVDDSTSFDQFGVSVAVSGDALAVGSWNRATGGKLKQGAVYSFGCVACEAFTIDPADAPGGETGVLYRQTMKASGPAGSYQFSISEGAAPPGLMLSQDGTLSGAPTAAGEYRFTITATNLKNLCTGRRSYRLSVASVCPTLTLSPAALTEARTGVVYNKQLSAAGGAAPYRFIVIAGALPTGIQLATNGELSGTPVTAGDFDFTILTTDANGCQGVRAYRLTIKAGECAYYVNENHFVLPFAGGQGTFNVATGNGCPWKAESSVDWISISSGGEASGTGDVSFTVAQNPAEVARDGEITVAGSKITISQSATFISVSAASFDGAALANECIVAAFGLGLATTSETARTQPLPTTLAGVRVRLRDRDGKEDFAPLYFASPNQINFFVPQGTAPGKAIATVLRDDEPIAAGEARVESVAPALFSADSSGQGLLSGLALRVSSDGAQSYEPVARFDQQTRQFVAAPIDPGPETDRIYLVIFATGIRGRSALGAVNVKIDGVDAGAVYAGPQGSFVGLDQINALLPRSLAGRGEVDLSVTVDGKQTNSLKLMIK
jgi:uncharacterized protein (TIGR03437 family)